MAIKHVVTLGFGFADGVAFIPTIGFTPGEAAAVTLAGETVIAADRINIEAKDRYTVKAGSKQTVTARRGKDRLGTDG